MSHTPAAAAATGTLKRAEFWTALSSKNATASKKGKALWTLGGKLHRVRYDRKFGTGSGVFIELMLDLHEGKRAWWYARQKASHGLWFGQKADGTWLCSPIPLAQLRLWFPDPYTPPAKINGKRARRDGTKGQGKHTTGVRLTREQVIHIRSHAPPSPVVIPATVSDLFGA